MCSIHNNQIHWKTVWPKPLCRGELSSKLDHHSCFKYVIYNCNYKDSPHLDLHSTKLLQRFGMNPFWANHFYHVRLGVIFNFCGYQSISTFRLTFSTYIHISAYLGHCPSRHSGFAWPTLWSRYLAIMNLNSQQALHHVDPLRILCTSWQRHYAVGSESFQTFLF